MKLDRYMYFVKSLTDLIIQKIPCDQINVWGFKSIEQLQLAFSMLQ